LEKNFNYQLERRAVVITPEFKIGAVFVADKPMSGMRFGFVGSNESALIRGIDSGNIV
jgi:hypothetical protein